MVKKFYSVLCFMLLSAVCWAKPVLIYRTVEQATSIYPKTTVIRSEYYDDVTFDIWVEVALHRPQGVSVNLMYMGRLNLEQIKKLEEQRR